MTKKELAKAIKKLGPWHQRYKLRKVGYTTDKKISGDFEWPNIRSLMQEDISELRFLELGSTSGYYSTKLACEGAEVVSVEPNPLHIKQSKWTKYYFENQYGKLDIKIIKSKVSQFNLHEVGWVDYILAENVISRIGNQTKQEKLISELCIISDKIIMGTPNNHVTNSIGYFNGLFLKHDFYMLKKIHVNKPFMLYGKLIKNEEYGW